jgi:O-antigen/teichoic acid export membrane protein
MGKIRSLAGETALYGLGSILPRVINFLLIKPHTKVFIPDEYSAITELYAYATFINVIFVFGMETSYFRFATKAGADERKIFNLAQTTVITISVALSVIFLLFHSSLAGPLSVGDHPEFLIWLVLIMFIDALVAIPFARLRFQKKALQFALGKVVNILIIVGINVYFIYIVYDPNVGVPFGVGFVFLANLIANIFYLIFFARTIIAWRPAYDPGISPHMYSYAYPIVITGLAGMTNETFSRLTLKWWLPENFYPGKSSEYALGVFGACYKFAMLMNLTVQSFRMAAEPFFFSNAEDKSSPQLFARINHYFIIVCCAILLAVSINIDFLKLFLGNKQYWEGLTIVPVLLLAYLFMGIYFNISTWFKLTDKTYIGTILAVGGAVITIAGNYILIPIAGYVGSSIVTLICYVLMTAACYVLGQRYYPIPYYVGKGLAYIIVTIVLVYVVRAFDVQNPVLSFVYHQTVVLAYLFVIYLIERKHFSRTSP